MAKEIDLRKCKPGDKLISCHGLELTYIKYEPKAHFPHEVKYPNTLTYGRNSNGSRHDNGCVFNKSRLDSDHDIVKVIRGKRVMQSAKRIPITPETEYKPCVIEVI